MAYIGKQDQQKKKYQNEYESNTKDYIKGHLFWVYNPSCERNEGGHMHTWIRKKENPSLAWNI